MDSRKYRDGDNVAVSGPIGVVLMLAILIILAAIVGPVVLGVGEEVTEGGPAPQFTVTWSYDDPASVLTLTHKGGETVQKSQIRFVGSNSGELGSSSISWSDADSEVSAGDSADLSGVGSDEIVRVFWVDPNANGGTEKQQLIAWWAGPDAVRLAG